MVLATLPHSDPKTSIWERQNGAVKLTIKSDSYVDQKTGEAQLIGIPYGVYPRLLLYWLTREVKLNKSRRLELGSNLSSFMQDLDLVPTGGRWGTISMLKKQSKRLFTSRITFEGTQQAGNISGTARRDMLIVEDSMILWDHSNPEQPTLFGNWIELSEKFYQAILESVVPIDLRGIKAVRDSALGLDLYAWLNYEVYRAYNSKKSRKVPWRALEKQLGSCYGRHRDFKKKAKDQLNGILTVYRDWDIEDDNNCLIIKPSMPSIMPQASGGLLGS
ncbi:MAG: replication protein RepA [Thermosynechococcaceae cyanobacterium]